MDLWTFDTNRLIWQTKTHLTASIGFQKSAEFSKKKLIKNCINLECTQLLILMSIQPKLNLKQ